MPPWVLVVSSGLAMSGLALVGGALFVLPESVQARSIPRLVAFAAGSLLGGAAFQLLPSAVVEMGGIAPWLWAVAGFVAFYLLETALRLRHHHDHEGHHHTSPTVMLILVADGLHNFVGGLAVSSAILVDPWVGLGVWLAEASHEIPQELGDFAILVQSGMSWRKALLWNFVSGLTFLAGGMLAMLVATEGEPAFLLAFGAGNFVYLALVDLVPDIWKRQNPADLVAFVAGFCTLGVLAWALP